MPLWRVCVNSALSLMLGKAWSATTPVAKETSMPRPQPSRRHPDLFASPRVDISVRANEVVGTDELAPGGDTVVPCGGDCRSPSSCRSQRRPEERIGAVVGSAGMLSLLSEAHRIVHGSRESDPSLCHGAALVARGHAGG